MKDHGSNSSSSNNGIIEKKEWKEEMKKESLLSCPSEETTMTIHEEPPPPTTTTTGCGGFTMRPCEGMVSCGDNSGSGGGDKNIDGMTTMEDTKYHPLEGEEERKKCCCSLDDIVPYTDLSDPQKHIWVVTTASLPWRTGTSINPLLRALHLTRSRQKGYVVTLVLPWLTDDQERIELYNNNNNNNVFAQPSDQEQWIRHYAIHQCQLPEETEKLEILFYPATYWKPFGSIFPMVDICSMIPKDKADVAILEEPEHLNWLRVPNNNNNTTTTTNHNNNNNNNNNNSDTKDTKDDDNTNTNTTEWKKESDWKEEEEEDGNSNPEEEEYLGWTHKFKFVVGVIHTNYAAYMKQYGLGTSIIGAPAIISAISRWVVRAYCHKVIRLSDVLPSYAKGKEITCNIHGVRQDFLLSPPPPPPATTDDASPETTTTTIMDSSSPKVYFIGKLLWAKGFDTILQVQDYYRRLEGNYFPMNVYGTGPDQLSIQRAFYGRRNKKHTTTTSTTPDNSKQPQQEEDTTTTTTATTTATNEILSNPESLRRQLFSLLKKQQSMKTSQPYDDAKNYIQMGFEVMEHYCNDNNDSDNDNDNDNNHHETIEDIAYVMERNDNNNEQQRQTTTTTNDNEKKKTTATINEKQSPPTTTPKDQVSKNETNNKDTTTTTTMSILGELSGKSVQTGIATTQAVKRLADTAISMVFRSDDEEGVIHPTTKEEEEETDKQQHHYVLDLPKSRFEWRRHPIPARFLGVKDHAQLRDDHHCNTIFLNTSVTEVLCTTTAEALAMGKFVIIPHHPSNQFFFSFPNCLTYHTLEECATLLSWALNQQKEPTPLTPEHRHKFTWEAATERLIRASAMTERELIAQKELGMDIQDARLAWWHYRGGENVGGLVTGKLFQQ